MTLEEMTDEQVLDAWHAAKMAHRFATTEELTVRMALKLKAEAAAIRRFGVGEHLDAYRRRFVDADPGDSSGEAAVIPALGLSSRPPSAHVP